jgi:hypothetical protein
MEEKVQQLQLQQEITNYKDEIKDLQEKLETLKVSILQGFLTLLRIYTVYTGTVG